MSWVPLHQHSEYSILDALCNVKAIAKRAAEFGMPACALTDHGNLYGAVEFYQACQKEGVKPIIGCEVYVAPESRFDKTRMPGKKTAHHLVLLAKNQVGYQNLCKLTSAGFTEGFYYNPRVDKELLRKHNEGLCCVTACLGGEVATVAAEGSEEELVAIVEEFKGIYGEDFYLELQRHPMSQEVIEADGYLQESWLYHQYESFIEKQNRVNERIQAVAKRCGVKLVATNDCHYIERDEWKAHEILLNIQSGEPVEIWEKDSLGNLKNKIPNPKRRSYPSHEFYFKSPDQMAELFSDVPEAIANTLEVAEKCNVEFDFSAKHYPVYTPPDLIGKEITVEERKKASEEFLLKMCHEQIPTRYTERELKRVQERYPDRDPMEVIHDRLKLEMDVIAPKGMCDYLLIVWDFIHWAKSNDIPVGPGRGSGAGSIILYLIGITDIEPLWLNLFFERFINPERLSYPDIDVDICMDGRGAVIDYTVNKYGKENVAQIITFGTMKAKMAIRDVGRVLNVPLSKVNAIAKLVPDELGITLEKALDTDPDLLQQYNDDDETRRLIDLAKKLEGVVRNTGIHAAGVIVSGEPLTEHIPVCTAKDSEMAVTQYSMKPVEKVGMLKIDFLGLKTLTCIKRTVEAIETARGTKIDPLALPLDDQPTFELLNQGQTNGVFQMESGGMQDLARQLHLDRFEEILAVVSLYRPGPMEMIPSFVARKHGKEPIEYDHPLMEEILSETNGIMVYQEQVMQMSQRMAKYSLGEGDVLRRAMGKKIMEEMAQQREKFREGSMANGIDEEIAMAVFDKMEQFAKYGFNKSHAACYGLITYITAFLKANYPMEWMAAVMTCDRDDISKVSKWIRECQSMGIEILPPDINEADDVFVATPKGIRFAMSGIKGVGHGVVEAIVEERKKNGPFEDLYDFFRRVDGKRVGKKVPESLVDAGAFDFTGWTRDQLRISCDPMFESSAKSQKDQAAGVMTLFSLMGEEEGSEFDKPPTIDHPSSRTDLLLREKELLGFFLSGHPMNEYKDVLARLSCVPFSEIEAFPDRSVFRSAFVVETVATKISSKNGSKFAILRIADGYESYELPVWSDVYEETSHLLNENQLLYAVLQVDRRDGGLRLGCKWVGDLTRVDEAMVKACDNAFDKAKSRNAMMHRIKEKESVTKKEKKEKPKMIQITLDADQIRLSQIVELKQLFRAFSGETPVTLNFQSGKGSVGRISIPARWGISLSDQLQKKIEALGSVVEFKS